MGWEDLIDVAGQVQDAVEMGRAEPSRGRVGWCNGIMMYIGLISTIWLIIPALLFRSSQNGWLKGRHKYPTFALWLGWTTTGVLAVAAPVVLTVFLREWTTDNVAQAWWLPVVAVPIGVLVTATLVLLMAYGIRRIRRERKQAFMEAIPSAGLTQPGQEELKQQGVPAAARAAAAPGGVGPGNEAHLAPASGAAYGMPSGPRKSWWGRQRRGAKVALVFAGLVAVIAIAAVVAPRIVDALKPSDAELVRLLATTTDVEKRQKAATDLAARHSLQATEDLLAEASTSGTAQGGLVALRDEYIARFGVAMDSTTLRENEPALNDAVQCLGLIGDADSIEALGNLSCSSQCDLASVRVAAAQALADTGNAAALPHLIDALDLPRAVDPQGETGEIASAALLDFPEAVPALIQARAESDDPTERTAIDKTLARIGEPAVQPLVNELRAMDWTDEVLAEIGAPAIPAVIEELYSDDAKARYRALGVLLRLFMKDEVALTSTLVKAEMIPLLIEARTQATYGDERDDAAEIVLARIGEAAVEPVMALLAGEDWAADVLADIGSAAVPALTAALSSDDREVRFAAADALVEIEKTAPQSVGALTTDLDEENLKSVATNYAYYIRLGQAGSEEILIRALNKYGDKEMALDYLNCGNGTLDEAARKWAAKNGYTVYTTPGSRSGPQWGEGN